MVINEGNVYNFESPKFDGNFLACCSCKDAAMCNTNRCECRWRSFDDNRKYDARKRVEQGHISRKKFIREEELYGYQEGKLDTDKLSTHILPVIYECHGRCPCKSKCSNAVVQDGVKQHLEIFLTKNKGWGVRPTARIPKGSYVCTYTGLLYPTNTEHTRSPDFQFNLSNGYKKYSVCLKLKCIYKPTLRSCFKYHWSDDYECMIHRVSGCANCASQLRFVFHGN